MKKNYLLLVFSLFLFLGCGSEIERVNNEVSGISKIKDDNQTSFTLPSEGGISMDINSSSGGITSDINDTNATVGVIKIDAKNAYKVSVKFSDNYNEKGYYSRGEIGELFFNITNIYTNEDIDTDIIEYIVLEMEEKNSDVNGTYLDFITYTGEQGPIYSIPKKDVKASDSVALKVKNISGTTNIILSVKIKDFDEHFILKIPIIIEKNKSSSMAIVPIGTRYENGLFIDKFVIHVVDSYGNKAIDGTNISTGVINNPKLYSNAYNGAVIQNHNFSTIVINPDKNIFEQQTFTERNLTDQELPFSPNGVISFDLGTYDQRIETPRRDENNTILKDENNNTIYDYETTSIYYPNIYTNPRKNHKGSLNRVNGTFSLNADSDKMGLGITDTDTLIILANKKNHKPENLGGWDIKSVNSDSELSLVSLDKSLKNIEDVSYVIGDEYRYIAQSQTIANGAASTFETTEVKDGLAFAELRYTPEMVGHNVFIYANTRLEDKHIGISRKLLLHGTGLSEKTLTCTNDKGRKPNCSRLIRIVQNDSGKGAYQVNIAQPQISGSDTFRYTTATRTNSLGWTTVSIYGIDENKTATVSFGSLINDEFIINEK